MKKELTPNKQEWLKNQKRAERFIKKYEKIGFAFDFSMPKMPERVTKKALEEFRRQTTAVKLSTKAVHIADEVTGDTESLYKYKQRRGSGGGSGGSGGGGGGSGGSGGGGGGSGGSGGGGDSLLSLFFEKLSYLAKNPYDGYLPSNLLKYLKTLNDKNSNLMAAIAGEADKNGFFDLPDRKYYYEEVVNEISTFFSDLFFKRMKEYKAKKRGYFS